MHFDSLVYGLITPHPVGRGKGGGGEGNKGICPPGPKCEGAPNGAELFQIRSGSLFSSQSSFFKGVHFAVLLISSQPAFLLPAYADDANFKLLLTLSYVTTAPAD